jgi:HEAT repeat protein
MRFSFFLACIMFGLVSGNVGIAQSNGAADGQLETTKQALKRHHIALNEQALLLALQHPDPEVRELAAQALAEDGHKDAISSIEKALLVETVPGNRVNISLFLAQLGDSTGRDNLKQICHDVNQPAYIRMLAAINMRYLQDESCIGAVFNVLDSSSTDDSGAKVQALSLLPSFKLQENSQRVLEAVTKALTDPTPAVRIAASSTLGSLGRTAAIPYLREVLDKEQESACRFQMSLDLQRLEKIKDAH